jgi:hypothetical protein
MPSPSFCRQLHGSRSAAPFPPPIEQWLLFEYVGLEFTPLSKPFKTREQAEKAREKNPERLRKKIGLSGKPDRGVGL